MSEHTKTITSFFSEEYRQMAQNLNFTKLANIMGYKVTANKVLHTVLDKNITSWQKVEVVSNITALETIYMGGSSNIDGVISNIAVEYVSGNNISFLATKGDHGSRLEKLCAASRYIFVKKHENFDKFFNKEDLNVLSRYNFEGQDIEYQFLTFNLPMLLVNGSEGVGSGHAQKILPRDPKQIMDYLVMNLKGKNKKNKPFDVNVSYNGYQGEIKVDDENHKRWHFIGKFKRINTTSLEITEVPINETYKAFIAKLDKLCERGVIKSYEDLCDPIKDTFKFKVYHKRGFSDYTDEEILDKLKLTSSDTENFTFIDENNSVKVAETANEVFWEYYNVKIKYLNKRKEYLISKLKRDIEISESKIKFIKLIIDDELIINKRKKADIVKDLDTYDDIHKVDSSYDFLLNMSISSLTAERITSLIKSVKEKYNDLKELETKTPEVLWLEDLKNIKLKG